jgi:hypothetical protein
MKTILKAIAGLCALCFLLFIIPQVHAQQYDILATLYAGGTNNVAAATTNSTAAKVIGLAKYDEVAIDVKFKLTGGTGTDSVVFKLDEGLDNSNWLANRRTISVAASGTNTVYFCTNMTVNSLGYLRLNVIENSNTNAITNLQIRAYVKPRRSG